MYVGRDFSDADPDEIATYVFDFTQTVGNAADPIVGISWTLTPMPPVPDPSAATRLSGPAVNGQTVSVLVSNLVGGVRYQIRAIATFGSGQTLSLWSFITCDANPPYSVPPSSPQSSLNRSMGWL